MEGHYKLRPKSHVDSYSHFSKTGTDVCKDKNKIDAQKEAERVHEALEAQRGREMDDLVLQ